MIIATAGHVDHGKSSLVRRLTGTDPDRWTEEQERGLTIDLGFAWTVLGSGRTAAFVDVPGHRRFVGNALAGCGAVDGVLLAVSAKEGWMPQTEEHVVALGLLGATTGVVALTFADAVDDDTLRRAGAEVAERLAGTFLEGAPIVATGAHGRTDGALGEALDATLSTCPTELDRGRPRLWLDRSFLLRGVGRVVTGTLVGGALAVGDRLDAVGEGEAIPLRVRSLRRNGEAVGRAGPGGRVAVAVSGSPAPRRGQALVRAREWGSGRVLEVALRPARDRRLPRPRGSYLVHLGTWSAPVRLSEPWGPGGGERGEITFARLHLTTAGGPLAPGDRFVVRDAGRAATVAGGTVLAVDAAPGRRTEGDLVRRLAAVSQPEPGRSGHLAAAALREVGGAAGVADVQALTGLAQPVGTRRIGATVVGVPALRAARRDLLARLGTPGGGCVRPQGDVEELAGASLVARGLAVRSDGRLHPSGSDPDERRQEVRRTLDAAVADGRLPPLFTVDEAAAATDVERRVLRDLVARGLLVEAPPFLVTGTTYGDFTASVTSCLAAAPATASELKAALGLSRKHAIPLLEALDRDGVTARVGDHRVPGPRRPDPA